jgi:hypothetical protein
MANRLVQWGVVLGVLWAILTAVIGNWDTQGHPSSFVPEIWSCAAFLAVTHVTAVWRLLNSRRRA